MVKVLHTIWQTVTFQLNTSRRFGDLEICGSAEFISHPALHLLTSSKSFFLHWALFRGAVHEASLNLDSWFIASCKLKVGGLLERREIQIG